MTPKTVGIWTTGKSARKLPGGLSRKIGHMTVSWGYLENYLQFIVCDLLDMEAGLGRLTVRSPRPKQQVELIRDVADHKKINYDKASLKQLIERIEGVSSRRDLVVHGSWGFVYPKWLIMRTNGKWPKQSDMINPPQGSRSFLPEGVDMDYQELSKLVRDIDELIELVKAVEFSFDAGQISSPTPPSCDPLS